MEFVSSDKEERGDATSSVCATAALVLTASEQQQMIRQVQSDTTKTSAEKSAAIKHIMQAKVQAAKVLKETCAHYDKKCTNFFFDCCKTNDDCHRCHAEYNDCTKRDIKTITCTECQTEQTVSNECTNCHIEFSHSHCLICKIWTAMDIFHCEGCGICRVGLAEDYTHCDNCNGCFSVRQSHTCQFFKPLDQLECLVCMESAHSSQDSVIPLPCGHG
jgi:RING finger/CHY zinc finger protein 1